MPKLCNQVEIVKETKKLYVCPLKADCGMCSSNMDVCRHRVEAHPAFLGLHCMACDNKFLCWVVR